VRWRRDSGLGMGELVGPEIESPLSSFFIESLDLFEVGGVPPFSSACPPPADFDFPDSPPTGGLDLVGEAGLSLSDLFRSSGSLILSRGLASSLIVSFPSACFSLITDFSNSEPVLLVNSKPGSPTAEPPSPASVPSPTPVPSSVVPSAAPAAASVPSLPTPPSPPPFKAGTSVSGLPEIGVKTPPLDFNNPSEFISDVSVE
jgi:hypothetical protein